VRGTVVAVEPQHLKTRNPPYGGPVSLPPLVEPAAELSIDEVRRYSRHLIIPDVGMTGRSA
jgi:adenylyltransferase/sulfurtransferase